MNFRTETVLVVVGIGFCHLNCLQTENPFDPHLLELIRNSDEVFHADSVWLDVIGLCAVETNQKNLGNSFRNIVILIAHMLHQLAEFFSGILTPCKIDAHLPKMLAFSIAHEETFNISSVEIEDLVVTRLMVR